MPPSLIRLCAIQFRQVDRLPLTRLITPVGQRCSLSLQFVGSFHGRDNPRSGGLRFPDCTPEIDGKISGKLNESWLITRTWFVPGRNVHRAIYTGYTLRSISRGDNKTEL